MADLKQLTIIDLLDLAELRNDSQSVHGLLEEIRRRVIDIHASYNVAVKERDEALAAGAKLRDEILSLQLEFAHLAELVEPA